MPKYRSNIFRDLNKYQGITRYKLTFMGWLIILATSIPTLFWIGMFIYSWLVYPWIKIYEWFNNEIIVLF